MALYSEPPALGLFATSEITLGGTAVASMASMEGGKLPNCLFSWAAKARLPAERKKRARVLNCMLKNVRH